MDYIIKTEQSPSVQGIYPGGWYSKLLQAQLPGDYVPGRQGFMSSFFISVSSVPEINTQSIVRTPCSTLSESMTVWRLNLHNLFLDDHLVTQWVRCLPKDWLTGKTPQKLPAHMCTGGSSHQWKHVIKMAEQIFREGTWDWVIGHSVRSYCWREALISLRIFLPDLVLK